MSTKFNVCIARKYKDNSGKERTHFWGVGKAFTFSRQNGGDGINIKLYSRTLMSDEFVLFEDKGEERLVDAVRNRDNKQELDTPGDDDIPF
jgi:hypothetical protein